MAQLAVEHHQRVKMTCRTHQTLWIEFSTKPEVIVEKQTVNCSDEFNSVDVEFEWSVFYNELMRQLSLS